jgi:hypothetical protein
MIAALWRRLHAGEPALALFGLLMLLAMLPALVALGLDERTLRGVPVWIKPLKFMASLALLAWTLAWFWDLVAPAARRHPALRAAVVTVWLTGGFEIAYITLKAARGEASHYNLTDPLHSALYTSMGVAAVLLTATQAVLAWAIWRRGRADVAPAWRRTVAVALAGGFVLGTIAGGMLGGVPPPSGSGLPLLGWHWGGDLRPAHFIGLHLTQVLPLVAWALRRLPVGQARAGTWLAGGAWTVAWVVAMGIGLDGAVDLQPPAT